MALDTEGEFEWQGAGKRQRTDVASSAAFRVLKEGYLNVNSNVDMGQLDAGRSALRKSFSRGWKKRWCALSQTRDSGASLLYYKNQSSPGSIDAPVGVLLMDDYCKVYPVPAHPKSNNVFAIEVPQRVTLFYADREVDTAQWLEALKIASVNQGAGGRASSSPDGDRAKRRKPLSATLSSPR